MKITLSLSAICLFSAISTALVVTDGSNTVPGASKIASHIIKLKESNFKNITGKYQFEFTSFHKLTYL